MCVGLWINAFFVDSPNFLGWGDHAYDFKTFGCTFDRLESFSYVIFLSTAIYWIPLSILLMSYVRIFMYVKKQRREINKIFSKMPDSPNSQLQRQRGKEDLKLIRTFFTIVVAFLLCWTPYFSLVMFDTGDTGHIWIYVIFASIGHFNSSLNSALYASGSDRFRKGYKRFLCMLCRKPKERYTSTQATISRHSTCSTIGEWNWLTGFVNGMESLGGWWTVLTHWAVGDRYWRTQRLVNGIDSLGGWWSILTHSAVGERYWRTQRLVNGIESLGDVHWNVVVKITDQCYADINSLDNWPRQF